VSLPAGACEDVAGGEGGHVGRQAMQRYVWFLVCADEGGGNGGEEEALKVGVEIECVGLDGRRLCASASASLQVFVRTHCVCKCVSAWVGVCWWVGVGKWVGVGGGGVTTGLQSWARVTCVRVYANI
jgi:hypothetical protein